MEIITNPFSYRIHHNYVETFASINKHIVVSYVLFVSFSSSPHTLVQHFLFISILVIHFIHNISEQSTSHRVRFYHDSNKIKYKRIVPLCMRLQL